MKYRLVKGDSDAEEIFRRGNMLVAASTINLMGLHMVRRNQWDHCRFLQALNVGGSSILILNGKSTETSLKKWRLYMSNNFTQLLLLLEPFRGGSRRRKKKWSRRTATLWELWPISVPQNCHRLENEWLTLVETRTHILGIVLERQGYRQLWSRSNKWSEGLRYWGRGEWIELGRRHNTRTYAHYCSPQSNV